MCIQSVIERVGGWVPESTTHRGASAMRDVHEKYGTDRTSDLVWVAAYNDGTTTSKLKIIQNQRPSYLFTPGSSNPAKSRAF
jgi:hypothetical protein